MHRRFKGWGVVQKPEKREYKKEEESLQIVVAKYLKIKYPGVIFRSDFAAGIKMSFDQAKKHKKMQSGRAYPDLFLAEPNHGFHGAYLELKKNREEVYTVKGKLRQKEHIQEQYAELLRLRAKGYKADFVCGIDEAMKYIDDYLK